MAWVPTLSLLNLLSVDKYQLVSGNAKYCYYYSTYARENRYLTNFMANELNNFYIFDALVTN